MVFFDLGANIGWYSLLAARIVGASGKVFSFEPDPEVAARLRRNIERNGFANISVVQMGVWSQSAEVNFIRADSSSPDAGTGRFASVDGGTGCPIACVALDDFILKGPPPDAIKCDVEGAEAEVLRGAEKLLRKHRPWILCETHSEANDRDVRALLASLGYSIKTIDQAHLLALP